MSKYRKIDPRIWNDENFRILSDKSKLVFLFLLTHPHMTSLGAMRATPVGLAAELNWTEKDFRKAFGELFRKPFLKVDETASFLWIPKFIKYNQPESPNVLKSWEYALDYIPECDYKYQLIEDVKAFAEGLGKGFREVIPKAFAEGVRKPLPNHEQEPEQEQEHEPEREKKKRSHSVPEDFVISEELKKWAIEKRPDIDVDIEIEKFRDYEFKDAHSDWDKVFRNWIRNARAFASGHKNNKDSYWETHAYEEETESNG